ncbi:hypothetical protein HNQ51_001967 [Inhella inkyongensis]|uniref:Carbohydrate-binding protein CenC n=1 Tax=Inhella inkyongensis TaxID=392593 RepID=A0A840S4M5_9BURK|nr:CehA/McbA family metallohydrolase [Inhella inkyongensis]MBB5204653.1 hypothetical protein [Inhella inkyongensis]
MHQTTPTASKHWLSAIAAAVLLTACGGASQDTPAVQAQAEEGRAKALAAHPSSKYPDHHEFEVELLTPFASTQANGARRFTVNLDYLGAPTGQQLGYRLDLIAPNGQRVHSWSGIEAYQGKPITLNLEWAGRGANATLADGVYEARLVAASADAGEQFANIDALLAHEHEGHGAHEQVSKFVLGAIPKARMPAFKAMPLGSELAQGGEPRRKALAAAATGSWPYTVYYGTLHGQTNDSDGGGALATCSSSQAAQSGQYGPADAYPYAKSKGLDFLANTEHNHYFDGSSSTNTSASPATAKGRYEAGLNTANSFTASNPGFLALYGMEWGVISNGGHLNIFNSDELYAWEYNASNELLGHRYIAKNDYASLYTAMRAAGVVGQFNHPDSSGQFIVNGESLGYTADGDEVMVLAEISNTSAFSNVDNESQVPGGGYESAYRKILEQGFHVAPATNQDNHCANWGSAYTNRTAVLIPNGTALTKASFIEALRARRVFATHDKNSQLVFSANGNIMGSRISNSGVLNLNAGFANSAGRTVSLVEIWEGVPGRKGTMTVLTNNATHSFTPTAGQHVYYAKLTQDDGKILWSAPIWVNQGEAPAGDTTPPTVTASESGSSGTITLSATASDNVGVSKVEFWVDGALKGTVTASPFSMTLDSKTLANGSHNLVAKAFDAAGNSASSTGVSFSISNALAGISETESNNTIATANAVGTATTVTGFMGSTTDKDYFKVSLKTNQKIRVDMVGPTGTDYDVYLVTSTGAGLARSEGATSSETFTYTNTATARTVYIKVQSYSGSSTSQAYTLTVTYP